MKLRNKQRMIDDYEGKKKRFLKSMRMQDLKGGERRDLMNQLTRMTQTPE